MEYYIVYDLNDNIIAYCDNIEELVKFTELRKRYVLRQFQVLKRDFIRYQYNNTYYLIYYFKEELAKPLFLCATLFLYMKGVY